MAWVDAIKWEVERVNIDYLTKNFGLREFKSSDAEMNGFRPDLITLGDNPTILELKCRTFPRRQNNNRIRPINDYKWWRLDPAQIKAYESALDGRLAWIFLLGETVRPVSNIENLSGRNFVYREILVLPWDIYKEVTPAPNEINIGYATIKRTQEFKSIRIDKGIIHISSKVNYLEDCFNR